MGKISTKGFSSSIGVGGSKGITLKSNEWGNQKSQCVGDPKGGMGSAGKGNTKGADMAAKKVGPMAKTPELSVGLARGDGQKRK